MGVAGLWPIIEDFADPLPLAAIAANRLVTATLQLLQPDHLKPADAASGARSLSSSAALSASRSRLAEPPALVPLADKEAIDADEDAHSVPHRVASAFPVAGKGPGYHPLVIAVDASMWVMGAPHVKDDLTMVNIFYKICKLLKSGILPVLVFDHRNHSLFNARSEAAQALAQILSIPQFTSAENAEAECAYLNSSGLVDGVLSDDGDSFLYGARIVLKSAKKKRIASASKKRKPEDDDDTLLDPAEDTEMSEAGYDGEGRPTSGTAAVPTDGGKGRTKRRAAMKSRGGALGASSAIDVVEVYNMQSMYETGGFTRGTFIAAALISGSDGSDGVPGLGIKQASELGKIFGDDLIRMVNSGAKPEELEGLRNDIIEQLKHNPGHRLSRRAPAAARTFPADWPSVALVRRYTEAPLAAPDRVPQLRREIGEGIRRWFHLDLQSSENVPGENATPAGVDKLKAWMSTTLGWSPEHADRKVQSKLAPILRISRLRAAAHKAATAGVVEARVEEALDIARSAKAATTAEMNKASTTPQRRRKSATAAASQSLTITHFFEPLSVSRADHDSAARDPLEMLGAPTPSQDARDGAVHQPSAMGTPTRPRKSSSFAAFTTSGHSSSASGQVMSPAPTPQGRISPLAQLGRADTEAPLLNEITLLKKFHGIDFLRVKISDPTNAVGNTNEPEQGQQYLEWVEAAIVRAADPIAFAKFQVGRGLLSPPKIIRSEDSADASLANPIPRKSDAEKAKGFDADAGLSSPRNGGLGQFHPVPEVAATQLLNGVDDDPFDSTPIDLTKRKGPQGRQHSLSPSPPIVSTPPRQMRETAPLVPPPAPRKTKKFFTLEEVSTRRRPPSPTREYVKRRDARRLGTNSEADQNSD
ncbi:hypothetical protein DFJ73DRAFT_22770 [Zopfochytrium polystomum]|nr:hypothetical protein DFJ73DRAFT_22770 [Zopfochytrium polystomum]